MNLDARNELEALGRSDAAKYLRETHKMQISAATLASYAHLGTGPIYRKAGKIVLYEVVHLDAWAATRMSGFKRFASDSDLPVSYQRPSSGYIFGE